MIEVGRKRRMVLHINAWRPVVKQLRESERRCRRRRWCGAGHRRRAGDVYIGERHNVPRGWADGLTETSRRDIGRDRMGETAKRSRESGGRYVRSENGAQQRWAEDIRIAASDSDGRMHCVWRLERGWAASVEIGWGGQGLQ